MVSDTSASASTSHLSVGGIGNFNGTGTGERERLVNPSNVQRSWHHCIVTLASIHVDFRHSQVSARHSARDRLESDPPPHCCFMLADPCTDE